MGRTACLLTLLGLAAAPATAAPPDKALALRDRGIAELENESPERAEATFRELVQLLPQDPLGHADLAIALLRQQQNDAAAAAIGRALEIAPGDPALLAIEAEVHQWGGDLEGALAVLRRAAAKAADDPQILFALYQTATTVRGEEAQQAANEALERLARLRPENAVVLLRLGQGAIERGDRTTATGAYLRIAELLWQEPPIARTALDAVTAALAGGDPAAARVPSLRLENVLKVSPLYRESLRELKTGIQGIPILRFRDEPPSGSFGDPLTVELTGAVLDPRPTAGAALAVGDFDGDDRPDVARVRAEGEGVLEVRLATRGWEVTAELPAPEIRGLLAADLDNDGRLDLFGYGPQRAAVWLGGEGGTFARAPDDLGLADAGGTTAAVVDFDIEGDLDLAVAGARSGPADLYRNPLAGAFERVGVEALPRLPAIGSRALVASDLDRDGDLDLLLAHARGFSWLDNLRQGRFHDRTAEAGIEPGERLAAAVAADLDGDGLPDLVGGGDAGVVALHNQGGTFAPWPLAGLEGAGEVAALVTLDADNDGRLDLAAAGPAGVTLWGLRPGPRLKRLAVTGGPQAATALAAADLDLDGDVDLLAAGPAGLHRLENQGGNRNHWLAVRLRGLDKGNSKNNHFGVGATIEVKSGGAYQLREVTGDVTYLGLGRQPRAEVLRVVWTNGVPQNRLAVDRSQRLVEEQVLKGSCPFLYAWDGDRFAFVTDLLWGAPLGLPLAPGVWAPADPGELVAVPGLTARQGRYELRITEELWEAAFFDSLRLWVVDHPADIEVASNLRIVPGERLPEELRASRGVRPVAAAWDGEGTEVTERVVARDEVYADGYRPSPYQGVAAAPWSFAFDLGTAPGGPIRLLLDGWIFPADASLNLAVAQRPELAVVPPRLEVATARGWEVLLPNMGYPAGKTKTMVVDTPPLPPGAHQLRIVTSLWLHWDRIAWTASPADGAVRVRARLAPASAELHYRGFSRLVRHAPNGPHLYDYATLEARSPWLPFPGRYTRYGDVEELVGADDDRSAILAAGDELAVSFDAAALPPVAPGMRRTLFLESHGWDKDADRNTFAANGVEPLPFRAMSGYPYAPGESFPDSPALRAYREEWLTRRVAAEAGPPR